MRKRKLSGLFGIPAGILLALVLGIAAGLIAAMVMLLGGQAAVSLSTCAGLALLAAACAGAMVLLIRLVRALQPKAPGKTAASSSQPRSEPEQWKLSYSSLKPLEEWGVEKTSRVPYDLLLSKVIAQFLCGRGYELERTVIGGGATEVSHTGSVAYDACYTTLEELLGCAEQDYLKADEAAKKEYGNWFSSLNYHFIRQTFRKPGALIQTEETACLTIRWTFQEGCGDLETVRSLAEYLKKEERA